MSYALSPPMILGRLSADDRAKYLRDASNRARPPSARESLIHEKISHSDDNMDQKKKFFDTDDLKEFRFFEERGQQSELSKLRNEAERAAQKLKNYEISLAFAEHWKGRDGGVSVIGRRRIGAQPFSAQEALNCVMSPPGAASCVMEVSSDTDSDVSDESAISQESFITSIYSPIEGTSLLSRSLSEPDRRRDVYNVQRVLEPLLSATNATQQNSPRTKPCESAQTPMPRAPDLLGAATAPSKSGARGG